MLDGEALVFVDDTDGKIFGEFFCDFEIGFDGDACSLGDFGEDEVFFFSEEF